MADNENDNKKQRQKVNKNYKIDNIRFYVKVISKFENVSF